MIKVIKKIKTYWCYLFTMFDRYIKLEKFVQQILSDSNEYKHFFRNHNNIVIQKLWKKISKKIFFVIIWKMYGNLQQWNGT